MSFFSDTDCSQFRLLQLYNSGKKEYFYGLKAHLSISESGIPVEIFLSPGSYPDTSSLYDFTFPPPEGSAVYGDKACNVHGTEDELKERGIDLMPIRKKNSRRKYDFLTGAGIGYVRKKIETVFSLIERKFPAHIHAVTSRGFELKTLRFILTCGIQARRAVRWQLGLSRCAKIDGHPAKCCSPTTTVVNSSFNVHL